MDLQSILSGLIGRRRSPARWARAIGCIGASAGGVAPAAGMDCASLTAITPEGSTITSAALQPAGALGAGVAFCRVQGIARPSLDSQIKF